jgi:hypothetical protein
MRALSVVLVMVTACASAARTPRQTSCEPVAPPIVALAGSAVFTECEVDKRARPPSPLSRLSSYTPDPNQDCHRAAIEFVVDSAGRPLRQTAVILKTNDPVLSAAMIADLLDLRFKPATKDGRSVSQLVRLERLYQMVEVVVPAGTPPPRRPPRKPPTC